MKLNYVLKIWLNDLIIYYLDESGTFKIMYVVTCILFLYFYSLSK